MKRALFGALGVAGLLTGAAVGAVPGSAADHLEAPLVMEDGRTDINDVYAFQSPENPDNTVLIMTVNPVAGVQSPTTFDPDASYRFQIDNDGDAHKDKTIRVKFGPVRYDGSQRVRVGGDIDRARGWTGETFELDDEGRVHVGTFDDPFFFDFQAFQDQVKGAGGSRSFCDASPVDFFAGLNVSAIVIEVPSDELTDGYDTNIGVWGETAGPNGRIDRMGRPTIATVLIDDGSEDAFNAIRPHRDLRKFGDQVKQNLLTLSGLDGSGYTDEQAQTVTEILLPDILTVDTANPAGYLNGRGLADDVIDTNLTVVTGGLFDGTPVLTGDCVDANDVTFPGTFPYLAPSH